MESTAVRLRRRLARTPAARAVAFPLRASAVGRHNAAQLRTSMSWLLHSREHTNFTYDLTPLNREHLAWFVAAVAEVDVAQARDAMRELDEDDALRRHLEQASARSARRGLFDREIRYGRRAGWYALVRCLQPLEVVETGTDKGLGSCVLAAALLRNGRGRLTTLDINPDSGELLSGEYATVTTRLVGDSRQLLAQRPEPVDLFLHDSDHHPDYERSEIETVAPLLRPGAFVLSDNAHETNELATWAERTGRRFLFFGERPQDHWVHGDGIGVATPAAGSADDGPRSPR